MNELARLFASKDFAWGVIISSFLMLLLMIYAAHLRLQGLYLSYKAGTAIKIGPDFYHLVSERDYVEFSIHRLHGQNEENSDAE